MCNLLFLTRPAKYFEVCSSGNHTYSYACFSESKIMKTKNTEQDQHDVVAGAKACAEYHHPKQARGGASTGKRQKHAASAEEMRKKTECTSIILVSSKPARSTPLSTNAIVQHTSVKPQYVPGATAALSTAERRRPVMRRAGVTATFAACFRDTA